MCTDVVSGLSEMIGLTGFLIPLIFTMTICGVRVVQRYKIDVPKYKQENRKKEGDSNTLLSTEEL